MATLINGNLNDPVYAAQDADLIAAICGNKTCIAPVGGEYAPTLEDANTIMVEDGVIITQEGRRIQLDAGDIDEFLIPTGTQGQTQYYICGYRLYTDEISAELCETFVEPVDSASETITEGTFRSGETEVYVSLLRVKQEGVNITEITELLSKSTDINQINNDLPLKQNADDENISTALGNDKNVVSGLNAAILYTKGLWQRIIKMSRTPVMASWGANVLYSKPNGLFLLGAYRIQTNDFCLFLIGRNNNNNNQVTNYMQVVNTSNHFTLVVNNQGTVDLKYYDTNNPYTYSYALLELTVE